LNARITDEVCKTFGFAPLFVLIIRVFLPSGWHPVSIIWNTA